MAEKTYKEIMAARWAAETEEQKESKGVVYQDIIDTLNGFRDPETGLIADDIIFIRNNIVFDSEFGEIDIDKIFDFDEESDEMVQAKESALRQMIGFFEVSRDKNTMPYQNVWESYTSLTRDGRF